MLRSSALVLKGTPPVSFCIDCVLCVRVVMCESEEEEGVFVYDTFTDVEIPSKPVDGVTVRVIDELNEGLGGTGYDLLSVTVLDEITLSVCEEFAFV